MCDHSWLVFIYVTQEGQTLMVAGPDTITTCGNPNALLKINEQYVVGVGSVCGVISDWSTLQSYSADELQTLRAFSRDFEAGNLTCAYTSTEPDDTTTTVTEPEFTTTAVSELDFTTAALTEPEFTTTAMTESEFTTTAVTESDSEFTTTAVTSTIVDSFSSLISLIISSMALVFMTILYI